MVIHEGLISLNGDVDAWWMGAWMEGGEDINVYLYIYMCVHIYVYIYVYICTNRHTSTYSMYDKCYI